MIFFSLIKLAITAISLKAISRFKTNCFVVALKKNHLCLNQQSWRSFSHILNTVLTGSPCIK